MSIIPPIYSFVQIMSGFICNFEDGIWALLGDLGVGNDGCHNLAMMAATTMASKLLMTYANRHNKVSALCAANAVRIGMR